MGTRIANLVNHTELQQKTNDEEKIQISTAELWRFSYLWTCRGHGARWREDEDQVRPWQTRTSAAGDKGSADDDADPNT